MTGVVALPDYADAILARMLGRDLSEHWGLHMVIVDAEYLAAFDAAFQALGEREDDLVEAAVGSMRILQVGKSDEDSGGFVYCSFQGVALKELLRPHYLGQSFVLEGTEGRKILFNVRECLVQGEGAVEAGVENPVYYRATLTVANPQTLEPRVRPSSISRTVDHDSIEGLVSKLESVELLAAGAATPALGVKIPTDTAEVIAFSLGVPVCKGRKAVVGTY
jgi:hypothetical protein